jgi:lipopolysaccharide export system protein LptA
MQWTIARLRHGILILAALLVAVLLGFLGYARYRLRHLEKDLPGRLGINIQQTANGYTYSQSSKGHTLYTIQASKLIQYKAGGNATLHDVSITLYGPEGSNRADKIHGSDFSYDAKNQIVSAQGTVIIDLQGFGDGDQAASPQNTIHVKTSGLVFNQKTAQADTAQHTEFSFPKAAGSCTGAHYNGKTGVLVLDSQVQMTTTTNGKAAVVQASHAQVFRDSKQAFLLDPRTAYEEAKGSADSAIVDFREDGTAQAIKAQGHVRIVTADGAQITTSNSVTQLDEDSQPTQSDLAGGIMYVSSTPDESFSGSAVSGTLTFGDNSSLKHAQFSNAVSFVDLVHSLPNDPKGSASRQIQASKIDVEFVSGADQKTIAQKALATGDAEVNLHTIPSKGPQETTTINGDQLLATLTPDGRTIRQLDGAGHTKIVDIAKDGSTNTSAGDRLQVLFDVQKAAANSSAKRERETTQRTQISQIDTAIQDGHVVLTQTPERKAGAIAPSPTLTAWADHAEYHASDQALHLTGNPRLYDGGSLQLAANAIDYHRDNGDAGAEGNIRATYTQQKSQNGTRPSTGGASLGGDGPVHITADHAFLHHATNVSTFYGSDKTNARMWQGPNSILAPILELSRNPETLKAYGPPGHRAAVVNANLTPETGAKHQQSVMRVHSQTLFYSDADRRGDFGGAVIAEDPDGVIRADEAQVYLTPKSPKGQQANQQAQLDRIVATGHVVITQPGRKGVGEMLVYTADNGRYVLTGSSGNPPRIEDAAKGTTTGTTLIFNSQDDSVVVSGGQSSAVTETRTSK